MINAGKIEAQIVLGVQKMLASEKLHRGDT